MKTDELPRSKGPIVPGFVLFLLCVLINALCAVAIANDWFSTATPYLLTNAIFVGVALWLSTVVDAGGTILTPENPTARTLTYFGVYVAVFAGIEFSVESRNTWLCAGVYAALTLIVAWNLWLRFEISRMLAGEGKAMFEAARPYEIRKILKWLRTNEGAATLSDWILALWLSTGLVFAAGQIPGIDFARPMNRTGFGVFMDYRALIFIVGFLSWIVTTMYAAVLQLPPGVTALPHEYDETTSNAFWNVSRAVARQLASVIHGARVLAKVLAATCKLAWAKLRDKHWTVPFAWILAKVAAGVTILWVTLWITPTLQHYVRDEMPMLEVWKTAGQIGGAIAAIFAGLLVMTFTIGSDARLSNRYSARLNAFTWSLPIISLVLCGTHWIYHKQDVELFPAFTYAGPAVYLGATLWLCKAAYDTWCTKVLVALPISLGELPKSLRCSGREVQAALARYNVAYKRDVSDGTLIPSTAILAIASGLNRVVKLDPMNQGKSVVGDQLHDLAKAMGVEDEDIIPQFCVVRNREWATGGSSIDADCVRQILETNGYVCENYAPTSPQQSTPRTAAAIPPPRRVAAAQTR